MAEEQCIALSDYDPFAEDEISFEKGDVIHVTAKGGPSGFWQGYVHYCRRTQSYFRPLPPSTDPSSASSSPKGTLTAKKGYFPSCFVTSNLNPTACRDGFCDKAVTLYDYKPDRKNPTVERVLTFNKGEVLTVTGPSAVPGWWYGVREASSSYSSPPSLFPVHYVSCDIVLAVFDFQGRARQELSCAVGDVILVHRRWNDGWWEGTVVGQYRPAIPPEPQSVSADITRYADSDSEGEDRGSPVRLQDVSVNSSTFSSQRERKAKRNVRGIFPSNYTIPNVPTKEPFFFCQTCKTILTYEDPSRGGGGGGVCQTCEKHQHIREVMEQNLETYFLNREENQKRGVPLDLFGHLSTLPPPAVSSKEGATALSPQNRTNTTTGHPVLLDSGHTEESPSTARSRRSTHFDPSIHRGWLSCIQKKREKLFSLLNYRDVAEVNSDRIKFADS